MIASVSGNDISRCYFRILLTNWDEGSIGVHARSPLSRPVVTRLVAQQRAFPGLARSPGRVTSSEDRASFTWPVLYDAIVTKYEWKQVRLYGESWWTRTTNYSARDAEKKAVQQRTESEQQLTDLLSNGWQIITIIPKSTNRMLVLQTINDSSLVQEEWVVFLQRAGSDFNPPSSPSW